MCKQPKKIADSTGEPLASALLNDKNHGNPCRPCLVSETYTTTGFLPKDVAQPLVKTKMDYRCGPDSLLPAALALGGSDVSILLANAFDLSIQGHAFPSQWKTAVITLVHKIGTSWDPPNYHPINSTSLFCKNMGRLIKYAFIVYLLKHDIIHAENHCFLSRKSCYLYVDYLNAVVKTLSTGKSVIVILLDKKKAFDRVPNPGLLNEMASCDVINPVLSWFSSYFYSRNQIVQLNVFPHKPRLVSSGAIRGSVLSRLLCLPYVNDDLDVI